MDWIEKPSGIWDIRPGNLRDPRAIFPPVKCLVLNGTNERIDWVFCVDFDKEMVGRYKTRVNELGFKVTDVIIDSETGVKRLQEEWFHCPGVHVIPFPPGYEEEIARQAQERKKAYSKKYRAGPDGVVHENEEKEQAD